MHTLLSERASRQEVMDISMSNWTAWPAVPGMKDVGFHALLMGDETAGPYLALVAIPPRTDPLPLFPAHGHGTDTWRITLRGAMTMGTRKYLPGEFRYQAGNKPYGSDDLAWGPNGGLSIVIMADRRGTPSFPPDRDPEKIRQARARTKPLFDWMGIPMVEDYAEPQGVASTLPRAPRAAHIESSFAESNAWPEIMPGVRAVAALLGHATAGPMLLHVQADPGRVVFPASRFETEVLHLAVTGSAGVGGITLQEADLRLIAGGTSAEALVAGPQGYGGTIVFGDRRGVAATLAHAGIEPVWAGYLKTTLEALSQRLRKAA